ncbi:MAG: S-layer homology domain-containing protein [Clostridia bacterium]|nr:S-layer homology domain-containing protein [Clostridia bacterium]
MKKRIITLLICVVLALSLATAVLAQTSQADAERLLGVLGIMNGDNSGELHLERSVTRAEFSKMLVCASSFKDSITKTAISTGFSDVAAEHWAAPYIRVASANKWIYGYSDGRFAPSDNIKLEEAATMLLRVLGYTSADISGAYPNGQLALYESLDLDICVEAQKGEIVDRKDAMFMLVNLLNAKTRGGQVYAQTLGYTLNVDGEIDINKALADELDGPYVYLGENMPFMGEGTKYIKDIALIAHSELEKYDILYYSKAIDTVWVYRNAVTGKYNSAIPSVSAPTSVNVGTKSYALETTEAAFDLSFMGKFEPEDMVTLLLGKDGGVAAVIPVDEYIYVDNDNYLELVEGTLEGPFVVKSSYNALGLPASGLSVKRNDKPSSIGEIKQYDVVYYSEIAKTLLVYSASVSGTYTSAIPNADTPAQITVAGNTYTLANSEVALSVSAIGTFRPGDFVTLLLGRNNEVAGVVSTSEYAESVYGIITSLASENHTDHTGLTYSAKTATVMTTRGNTLKLEGIKSNLSSGDIVKISYTDTVNVEKLKARSASGSVSVGAIGEHELAPDVNIIETDIYGNNPAPLFFSRLTGATLEDEEVRYYALDSKGKITDLILRDFSGDGYTYGIITEAESASGFVSEDGDLDNPIILNDNFVYEYQIGTKAGMMTVSRPFTYQTGPAVFKYDGNTLIELSPLKMLAGIDLYTSFGIVSNDKLYLFSDDMCVYTPNTNKQSSLDYSVMKVSELTGNIGSYNIRAYYDDTPEKGGRIRIIIANKK